MLDDNMIHASGTGSYSDKNGLEVHVNGDIFGIKYNTSIASYYRIEDCNYGSTVCARNNTPERFWNTTNTGTTCTVCVVAAQLDGHLRGRFWPQTVTQTTAQTYFSNNGDSSLREIGWNNI